MKLVTTQAGGGSKPTAIITTSQASGSGSGQTPSNILGISSVQPQGTRVVVSGTLLRLGLLRILAGSPSHRQWTDIFQKGHLHNSVQS